MPKWMISHDLASGKSAERYKSAMRVVGEAGSSTVIENDNFKIQNQIATRRIVFGALTFLIIAIGSLSAIGIISTTILLIPATALAIYVIHVRRQVVAAQLKARRIKAFEKINLSYDYNYIFRTNLSSFIRIDLLLEKTKHINDIYGFIGNYNGINFISGAGMLLTKKNILIIEN